MINCVCGSPHTYENCCKPYHDGASVPSAEAMVRARYAAFALGNYAFIVQTMHPIDKHIVDEENLAKNMSNVHWHSLHITECGQEVGRNGDEIFDTVTFSAVYETSGKLYTLSEVSYFQKIDGKLYYLESISHRPEAFKRPSPKIGRNDACPCGSGKKYKKCCA